ncbi:hypothetical protein ACLB2K_060480 [Fragaria x ananassa]
MTLRGMASSLRVSEARSILRVGEARLTLRIVEARLTLRVCEERITRGELANWAAWEAPRKRHRWSPRTSHYSLKTFYKSSTCFGPIHVTLLNIKDLSKAREPERSVRKQALGAREWVRDRDWLTG